MAAMACGLSPCPMFLSNMRPFPLFPLRALDFPTLTLQRFSSLAYDLWVAGLWVFSLIDARVFPWIVLDGNFRHVNLPGILFCRLCFFHLL